MIETFALAVVVLSGLYLLALGAASLLAPARAGRFLLGFAGSLPIHILEMFLRCLVGAALVLYAPRMYLSGAFHLFGWVLLLTALGLLLLPWRWHQRFARRVVPPVTGHMAVVGLVSLALGGLILAAVVRGSAA